MKKLRFFFFCFFLSGCVLAGVAQVQEPLTWQYCLREAAQNNPDLAAAEESVRKAQADYRGSFSDFLPQVTANASQSNSHSDSITSKEYSMGFSARQSLFSGFSDKAGLKKSRIELETAEIKLHSVQARVGFNLKSAFIRLLYTQEQLKLAETIASRRQENVRLVGLRHEAGREHKGSLLRSRAARHQAEFEVSQARRALKVAQRELARVLGKDEFKVIEVTGNFGAALPEAPPDFKSLAQNTPSYLESAAQVRSAHASLTIARSSLYPDLDAAASISRRGSDWPPDSERWSAGLSFSFPFFPGGKNFFDIQSAKAEQRRAQANFKSVSYQTMLDLEQAFAGFQDAAERTDVQKEFLEAAQVRSEIARSQYASGLLSFEDWDIIENDLITTQKTRLASLRDAVLAEAAWELAQGRGAIP